MVDDVGLEQARLLIDALYEQVAKISQRLESTELRGLRTSVRGAMYDRREQSELRRDLYEAHRLIDGLHRKFPATDTRSRRQPGAPRRRMDVTSTGRGHR